MRARYPDVAGHVERDGVHLGYEVFGEGEPTVLLLPTWTIVHSRAWKAQVPYLSHHYRVITYDGPGNGRSDRVTDPGRYSADSYARDALAVMDECGVERAVVVGVSKGAAFGTALAADYPDRVLGLVMIGPALPLTPQTPARETIMARFAEPYPDEVEGWDRYNLAYWHDHYADFVEFFFSMCFSEPHSTKQIEDTMGWAKETGPEQLQASSTAPTSTKDWSECLRDIRCPTLVIHGKDDEIQPHSRGVEAARLTEGTLLSMEGSGHLPQGRDPVKVNLALKDFIDQVAGKADTRAQTWSRGLSRPKRALYLSSPIGLGHVRRDLAIATELKKLRPDLQIDWLAQDPVSKVLEAAGKTIHPASRWLASESGHITSEAAGHDLHCFQALRRMDEILLANFMIFQEVVEKGEYDLIVGDEAWDVDYFWHENPELKRGAHVWMTDFVGFLPMLDGGEREAFLTADYNAEMVEHIARFPQVRDRAIFVGNPDDIYPETFGSNLPKIRDWTEDHFDFSGYVTGFTPPGPDEAGELRARLGFSPEEKVCVVSVGGSGVGRDLLQKVISAFPIAKRQVPELRMIAVAGPRIDPDQFPDHPGLEVHGYVDRLHRHLSVCDLAVVQGGLTTTMELTAASRPFLYFPLRNHFEQNYHVRYRLEQYRAGQHMDYSATDADALAAAIAVSVGQTVDYRPVETDGAERAARMISQLI